MTLFIGGKWLVKDTGSWEDPDDVYDSVNLRNVWIHFIRVVIGEQSSLYWLPVTPLTGRFSSVCVTFMKYA